MNIREKILIVEDEKSIAHFISTILNSNDHETLLARSGSEAKTMIASHCPDHRHPRSRSAGHGRNAYDVLRARARVVEDPAGGRGLRPQRTSTARSPALGSQARTTT